MAKENLLDRLGVDVVAAADHQILGPTGDPEIALIVEATEVPATVTEFGDTVAVETVTESTPTEVVETVTETVTETPADPETPSA